jgi:hypothetical protein
LSYIGTPPSNAFTSLLKQDFSTSATTGYTLDHAVNNANDIALFINFVRQEPTAAYAASGTTLTLTSATASSDDMYCVYLGQALQTVNPANASVGTAQLIDGAVTSAKLASGTGGKILQVVNAKTNTQFNTTSTSLVAVTNLSAAITPSATSSKVLIMVNFTGTNATAGKTTNTTIYRDSTNLAIQSSTGIMGLFSNEASEYKGYSYHYLDAPSSTSALTYQVYVKTDASGTAQLMVNGNTASITLMEIAG